MGERAWPPVQEMSWRKRSVAVFFRLVFSDAQRDAHHGHSHILLESCQSYRRRCTNHVRSTVYRFRICPAAGRARVFRCIELPFGFLQCPVVLAPFSRLEILSVVVTSLGLADRTDP